MKTDAAWALTAYAAAVIAAPVTAISDVQALVYGIGSGIAGGVLAGLMANKAERARVRAAHHRMRARRAGAGLVRLPAAASKR